LLFLGEIAMHSSRFTVAICILAGAGCESKNDSSNASNGSPPVVAAAPQHEPRQTPPPDWTPVAMLREALLESDHVASAEARIVWWARAYHREPANFIDLAVVARREPDLETLFAVIRCPRGRSVPIRWQLHGLFDAPFVNERTFARGATEAEIVDFACETLGGYLTTDATISSTSHDDRWN